MERIIEAISEAMKKNKFEDLRNDATNVKEMIQILKEMYDLKAKQITVRIITNCEVLLFDNLYCMKETPYDNIKVHSILIGSIINYYGQTLVITINI